MAGTWYPRTAGALEREIDALLAAATDGPSGRLVAVLAPHAGLMFSGHVGAFAYRAAARRAWEAIVLVGPSHHYGFDGVAVWPRGAFGSPLGTLAVDEALASALLASPHVRARTDVHLPEHALEMQLPFLARVARDVPIVPLLMGFQTRAAIEGLADALAAAVAGREVLLVASSDLSHYFDARRASALDGAVLQRIDAFDPEGLLARFEEVPEGERGRFVACGGGPAIAVMLAARRLGARHGRVLKYAHSGDISGDHDAVVGYAAAAFGDFDAAD